MNKYTHFSIQLTKRVKKLKDKIQVTHCSQYAHVYVQAYEVRKHQKWKMIYYFLMCLVIADKSGLTVFICLRNFVLVHTFRVYYNTIGVQSLSAQFDIVFNSLPLLCTIMLESMFEYFLLNFSFSGSKIFRSDETTLLFIFHLSNFSRWHCCASRIYSSLMYIPTRYYNYLTLNFTNSTM